MALFKSLLSGLSNSLNAPNKRNLATKALKEHISIVLRRQVPIRSGEEVRSWIGGLPKMPARMEWPHATPKTPLHFIAQINCADLPSELWGGFGPREGWLLLFADIEALTDQIDRPFAQLFHVTKLGHEAEPPPGLYWARNNLFDVSEVKGAVRNAQRRHFRKWPVDLVPIPATTGDLSGSELYGAPENNLSLGASGTFAIDRPMTWRGAYTILAALVMKHDANGYELSWRGGGGLLDYPEPDANDFNKVWQQRREQIAAQLPGGYHCPEFTEADERLKAQMYEERRKGWTQRAFKVLEEQGLGRAMTRLANHRAKLTEAQAIGDNTEVQRAEQSIASAEDDIAKHRANRVYLEELFAQYPTEETFTAQINRAGRAHLQWAQSTQAQLRELLVQAGKMDLEAPIAPADWDRIAANIASMKTSYWQKTYDTDLLRKVVGGVHFDVSNAVREEVLDRYTAQPSSDEHLYPGIVANLEPRLRHLETGRPHKMGGMIDSVYGDPLDKDHILLFQIASDEATGWIMGDLGLFYVSIHRSDLTKGAFHKVHAWLEA